VPASPGGVIRIHMHSVCRLSRLSAQLLRLGDRIAPVVPPCRAIRHALCWPTPFCGSIGWPNRSTLRAARSCTLGS